MVRATFVSVLLVCFASAPVAGRAASAGQDVIAPGTKITAQNWQQYRKFMSDGMIALFEGSHFWRVPTEVEIDVGPTVPIPLPAKYLNDTEKDSQDVHLTQLPTGGYAPTGYVAGIPFPRPLAGDPALIGNRIFWNSYYRYQPRVQAAPNYSYSLDQEGNMTQTSEATEVNSQLAFLSDPGYPTTTSDAGSLYFAKFEEQIAPEQSKYSTLLDLIPADPTQLDELYEYVPTLRRSLRLSQAARCAPVFGSDYLIDDENEGPPGLPQLYKIDYLGEKKILALVHATPAAFDSAGTASQLDYKYFYPGSRGIIPFPKPAAGKWELRDCYVISMERLPRFAGGYCYGRRVMYIDKENYFGGAQLDLFDSAYNLYKFQAIFSYPAPIPNTNDVAELAAGPNVSILVNFKDEHLTVQPNLRSCVNSECARNGYLDTTRFASPEGLMKIVR
jgi:Protein of unknown function (DUF1329)